MTPVSEFLTVLAETAEKECMLAGPISLKELPAEGGLYAEVGEGFVQESFFDKTETKTIPVLILCRDADQRQCMDQLESICNYFQRLKTYPSGNSFSWLDAEIAKYPSKIGRDEDGVYHYSCILNCKLYF